jgi:hypothetical protein
MEDTQNPYAPPKSDTSIVPEKQEPDIKKVFSPVQGSLGSLLGGPLAGAYFVWVNFLALGNRKRARLAVILGTAIAGAITFWDLFRTDAMLNYSIVIFMTPALIAWLIIARVQFTRAQIVASSTLTFHSNRRVASVGLLGLIVFASVGLAVGHFLSHR